ncbi:MAG: phosphoglucosamine mutase [Gammaproteobacteria bacterium]|nr:MAG: phosphoglucosamine mutase [Gammaproteobacteria bacterium]
MSRRYFGTDGVRGKVGHPPVTADFALKLGWATGKVFAGRGQNKVLIGKDTRISGYMFESALEAGLVSAGIDAVMLGPMPTPAIAYLTRTFRACAGIVISASHNPYYDNGIKFFSEDGEKLPDEIEQEIEQWLMRPMDCVESDALGKVRRLQDARGRYIEFCKSRVPSDFSLQGQKIVVDCANGATYHIAPAVFEELGAEVIAIGIEPNGLNINEHVGSTHPETLKQKVLEVGADLGVAFDGDGDRVVMVDDKGELHDGDHLLYVLAAHAQRQGRLAGGVVGTVMTNLGLELAFRKMDIPFARAKVGDRYVMEMLKQNRWMLGGESSGHIICRDCTTTGDGIIAALRVLVGLRDLGLTLAEAGRRWEKTPQVLKNVRVKERFDPMSKEEIQRCVTEVTHQLGDAGRVLLRASGTEPVIRVMVEGRDKSAIEEIADQLVAVVARYA